MYTLTNSAELLNNLPGMVFQGKIGSPIFQITNVSAGCASLLGYEPNELCTDGGIKFLDLIHADDKETFTKLYKTTLCHGMPLETTFKIVTNKGTVKIIWLNSRVADTDSEGMPYIIEGIAFDVSKQLRIEVAKYANRDKAAFFSRMSGEIRSSMNAILGIAEIGLMKNAPESILEHVKGIKLAGGKLMTVMSGALDFTRLENNDMVIYSDEYSISALLVDVVRITRSQVLDAGLNIHINIDETLPNWLMGDEDKLKQVLIELITNAIKFTDNGFISLSLEGYCEDGCADLTFLVEDTGRGIKDEDLDNIFTAFMQFDSKSIEGLGLGLTVARGMIRLMGGELEGSSIYELGSIFTIKLSQQLSKAKSPKIGEVINIDDLREENYDGTMVTFTTVNSKVLIVDDIITNLEVAKGLLHPYKLEVDVCTSGLESLLMVKTQKYDLVFMDIMIPVMDGIETVSLIRALRNSKTDCQNVPIVALTADDRFISKDMVKKSCFDDILFKPIDLQKLDGVLAKWIPQEKQIKVSESTTSMKVIELEIPNVNTKTGIRLSRGNLDLYLTILRVFFEEGRKVITELGPCLDSDNIEKYGNHAHSLKSASSSIGAEQFSRSAAEMEKAAQQGDEAFIKSKHNNFIVEFGNLLDGISSVIMSNNPSHSLQSTKNEIAPKKTALIIDDTDIYVFILEGILESKYKTLTAQNGEDGLIKAKQYAPDVILLDLIMPGLSGFDVLARIKSDKELMHIPVILISGIEEESTKDEGYALGAAAYINKPFESEEVIRTVDDILKNN